MDSPWDELLFAVSVENLEDVRKWLAHPDAHPNEYDSLAIYTAIQLEYASVLALLLNDARTRLNSRILSTVLTESTLEMATVLVNSAAYKRSSLQPDALLIAATTGDFEAVRLIYESRPTWSWNELQKAIWWASRYGFSSIREWITERQNAGALDRT